MKTFALIVFLILMMILSAILDVQETALKVHVAEQMGLLKTAGQRR